MAAPNADFQFTEGHVRVLLWMCDNHQDWVDRAVRDVMKNGDQPSDNLMNCREGINDLKCWGLRLLEVIEATPDDDDDEYDDDDYDDEDQDDGTESFADDLDAQWRKYRGLGNRRRAPLQKLRKWLVSLLS